MTKPDASEDALVLVEELRKLRLDLEAIIPKRGVDGLTDAERLALKQAAEIHNRLSENAAAVKENTGELRKILTEIQDWKTRQKIEQRTPSPGTFERKMSRCGSATFEGCGQEIYWENKRPHNPDGSDHRCVKR